MTILRSLGLVYLAGCGLGVYAIRNPFRKTPRACTDAKGHTVKCFWSKGYKWLFKGNKDDCSLCLDRGKLKFNLCNTGRPDRLKEESSNKEGAFTCPQAMRFVRIAGKGSKVNKDEMPAVNEATQMTAHIQLMRIFHEWYVRARRSVTNKRKTVATENCVYLSLRTECMQEQLPHPMFVAVHQDHEDLVDLLLPKMCSSSRTECDKMTVLIRDYLSNKHNSQERKLKAKLLQVIYSSWKVRQQERYSLSLIRYPPQLCRQYCDRRHLVEGAIKGIAERYPLSEVCSCEETHTPEFEASLDDSTSNMNTKAPPPYDLGESRLTVTETLR
ncbi:MAG: hypothetical protein MHM6MM_004365 [Cercozoa sp. M6MM]